MEAFETAFEEITWAELVLVTTGMGLKEWVLYTADFDAFIAEFKQMLRGKARAPVTITSCRSPLAILAAGETACETAHSGLSAVVGGAGDAFALDPIRLVRP